MGFCAVQPSRRVPVKAVHALATDATRPSKSQCSAVIAQDPFQTWATLCESVLTECVARKKQWLVCLAEQSFSSGLVTPRC